MKIQEIRELIKLVNQSAIDEFEYEQDGTKVFMKKGGAAPVGFSESAPVHEEQATAPKPPEPAQPRVTESVKAEQPERAAESEPEKKDDENLHKIESPMVGTFYTSPSPDDDAYVGVGDRVKPDSVVCIVEAMKLFNEIEAEVSGEIVEILAENGELVEYGQPLFLVKPD